MILLTSTSDLQPFIDMLTSQGGVIAICLVIIWTLIKKKWAPWWVVEDKERQIALWRRQSERWEALALHGTNLAEIATLGLTSDGDTDKKAART